MQTLVPPATPTDYTARGARNTPTTDAASPVPPPGVSQRGVGTGVLDQAVEILRKHPAQTFLFAVVVGWSLGAWTRRRRGKFAD